MDFMGGEEALKKSAKKAAAKATVRKTIVGIDEVYEKPLQKVVTKAANQIVDDVATKMSKISRKLFKKGGSQVGKASTKELAKTSLAAGLTTGVVGLVTNSVVDLGHTAFFSDDKRKWSKMCGRFGCSHVPSAIVDVGTEGAMMAAGTAVFGAGAVASWPFVGAMLGVRFAVSAATGY